MKMKWVCIAVIAISLSGCGFMTRPDTGCSSDTTRLLLAEKISSYVNSIINESGLRAEENSTISIMTFSQVNSGTLHETNWVGQHECFVSFEAKFDEEVETVIAQSPMIQDEFDKHDLKVSGNVVTGNLHFNSQPTGYQRAHVVEVDGHEPLMMLVSGVAARWARTQQEHNEPETGVVVEPTEEATVESTADMQVTEQMSPEGKMGPSFDCAAAGNLIEQEICNSAELSALDLELATQYQNALARTANSVEVKRAQRAWLRDRRSMCLNKDCLSMVYQERIAELNRIP